MKLAKKIFSVFLVLNGVGISVALMLASGLGTDSIGLLSDGIHAFFKVQYGFASLIYNLIVIVIAFFVSRKDLALGSICYALLGGYFIEFYFWIFQHMPIGDLNMPIRLLMSAAGVVILSFSLATLISLKLGMNALDAILFAVEKKTKVSYRVLRTITDISYCLLGTLMGGVFGIGSIMSMLCTGYLIDFFSRWFKKREEQKALVISNNTKIA